MNEPPRPHADRHTLEASYLDRLCWNRAAILEAGIRAVGSLSTPTRGGRCTFTATGLAVPLVA